MLTPTVLAIAAVALAVIGYFTRDRYVEHHASDKANKAFSTYFLLSTPLYVLALFVTFLASTALGPSATIVNGILWEALSFNAGYFVGFLANFKPYTL